MQLTSHSTSPAEVEADWLIVGVWEQEGLSGAPAELDTKMGGVLTRLLDRGDMTGKARELTPVLDTHGVLATSRSGSRLGAQGKNRFRGARWQPRPRPLDP